MREQAAARACCSQPTQLTASGGEAGEFAPSGAGPVRRSGGQFTGTSRGPVSPTGSRISRRLAADDAGRAQHVEPDQPANGTTSPGSGWQTPITFPPSAAQHQLFEERVQTISGLSKAAWQRLAAHVVGWQQIVCRSALPQPCQLSADTQSQLQVRQQWRKQWRRPACMRSAGPKSTWHRLRNLHDALIGTDRVIETEARSDLKRCCRTQKNSCSEHVTQTVTCWSRGSWRALNNICAASEICSKRVPGVRSGTSPP